MEVFLDAIGLCAPGLPNWPAGQAALAERQPHPPEHPPEHPPQEPLHFNRVRLPRNEARRAPLAVRLALQAATEALDQAGIDAQSCSAVFACSGGNTEALDALCQALTEPDRPISPNQFSNSVHSAPLGYWTISARSQQSASSVGAYDASFAAGLLEAATLAHVESQRVLLVAFDAPPPAALQPFRAVSTLFSMALLLGSEPRTDHLARLQGWRIQPGAAESMTDSDKEQLRLANPA